MFYGWETNACNGHHRCDAREGDKRMQRSPPLRCMGGRQTHAAVICTSLLSHNHRYVVGSSFLRACAQWLQSASLTARRSHAMSSVISRAPHQWCCAVTGGMHRAKIRGHSFGNIGRWASLMCPGSRTLVLEAHSGLEKHAPGCSFQTLVLEAHSALEKHASGCSSVTASGVHTYTHTLCIC